VPDVSEVWVVGNAPRLEEVLRRELSGLLTKPLSIVPQYRNLLENVWQTYLRILPGAGPNGREPREDELDLPVLYLSCDIPLATPHELSAFIRQSLEIDCEYALGLVTEDCMAPFYSDGTKAGISMAYFNLAEHRLRQSNLHLVKPPRLGNRQYIQEMYENRYQKQLGNAIRLAWTVFSAEGGGARVLLYYSLMHIAGACDRRGWRAVADVLRRFLPIDRVERAVSSLLNTDFRFVITEGGGCAVDVDNEEDFDVMTERFEDWSRDQAAAVEARYGTLAVPPNLPDFDVKVWTRKEDS